MGARPKLSRLLVKYNKVETWLLYYSTGSLKSLSKFSTGLYVLEARSLAFIDNISVILQP